MRSRRASIVIVTVLIVAAAGMAVAQSRLPKLPAAYTYAQTGDSPGAVTFNHESHVDPAAPGCTSCHPKLFSILVPGGVKDKTPLTHEAMGKGAACGACHNGERSFGIDDCTLCHR